MIKHSNINKVQREYVKKLNELSAFKCTVGVMEVNYFDLYETKYKFEYKESYKWVDKLFFHRTFPKRKDYLQKMYEETVKFDSWANKKVKEKLIKERKKQLNRDFRK